LARKAFTKAIELNDRFAAAQRNLARILIAEKNFGGAAILLERSLESEPNNAWALTNAAYAELQRKKFVEAADHARRVHALPHEGLANAHVIAGHALEVLGKREEAITEFRHYLEEDPKGPNVTRVQQALARLESNQN
jgi:tetratricopeptide (TPR) repeat protein